MPWALRMLLARARPYGVALALKIALVGSLVGAFLWGDYRIFARLFAAARRIEELTPFFALGLIENFLGLVFLIATMVLFFSAMTSAIGALFTDLDLETYHAAPRPRVGIAASRLAKTYFQSSYLVILFLTPLIVALQRELEASWRFTALGLAGLLLLLAIPVGLASTAILLLVRYFPVRRVHQIAMTLAIVVLTLAVVGVRMARPERLFAEIATDDVVAVLDAIRLPSSELYPSSWLASGLLGYGEDSTVRFELARIAIAAAASIILFLVCAHALYFRAFVRARETSAPAAIGAGGMTRLLDRSLRGADPQTRALFAKEARMVTRDAAQWSQLFMMGALLFIYLYNIQMMPLEGDFRAAILAYLNLGMSGFVIAAICLRFAYPSVSAEGRQFWILETAPISFRRILWTKVAVYLTPLMLVSLVLTALANILLEAGPGIWSWTLTGSFLSTTVLVSMGVGLGAMSPDFRRENPMEVALSLGGLGYMALSMLYIGTMMFLLALPVRRFVMRIVFGAEGQSIWMAPLSVAVGVSAFLAIVPIELAVVLFRRHRTI